MCKKHDIGPEEALNVQSGPRWEKTPKKFILASGGEEEKNKFTVPVHFEAGSRVPGSIPHQAAKGTQSVDGQRNSTRPDLSSPGFRMAWSSHSGVVRQRG